MKTSDAGVAFIAGWEGEVLHVYKDCVGIPTVGVGHVVLQGEDFSHGITHEQALEILRKDLGKAEQAVARNIRVPLTQNQFDALVSLVFNAGAGAVKGSTLAIKLNAGDYAGAADEFPKWCHAGGKVNAGLLRRRMSEQQMFLREDPAPPTMPKAFPAPYIPSPDFTPHSY
jgi:lysozyme